jgi:WD40 repeat protein
MFKKILIVLCLLVLLLPAAAYAQQPPQAVTDAVAVLNQKLGTNLSIADMASWAWEQKNFPDISMGCPIAGQTYNPILTNGFVVTLIYNAVTYDIRVSADRKIMFLCSPGGGAPGGTAGSGSTVPTAIPTLTPIPGQTVPVNPSNVAGLGTVVCTGGQVARLAIGMQGQAITTGSVNIRATAGATGQVAGLLLPQGIFSVVGGPQCVGNQTWWQISYTTQTGVVTKGWVMEGDAAANDYWLQPYGATTAPAVSTAVSMTRLTTANASLIRAVTQNTLPTAVYQAALPLEVSPDVVIVNVSRETKVYSSTLVPLLALGTNMMESVAFVALGSGSYKIAATEFVSGSTMMNLWIWTITPGTAGPIISGQYGVMAPTINSLTFSPDGKRLAAGTGRLPSGDPSVQNGVWVWDTTTNAQIAGIPFAAPVSGVTFSPDGSVIAAATTDNVVHLWSLATNAELAALPGSVNNTMRVKTVTFSPNGMQIAVIGSDWAVRVWDMTTRTLKLTLPANPAQYPRTMTYSPDSALLVLGGDTTTFKAFISVWDAASGTPLVNKTDFDDAVMGLGFNPDGTQLNVIGQRTWSVWAAQ